jgi:hypothetical protein
MTPNEDDRLPEATAKQVLARAAQLDASDRMSVSIPDLRAAAGEAGISAAALNRALTEFASRQSSVSERAEPASTSGSRKSKLRIVALIAAVIVLLGWTAIFLSRAVVGPTVVPESEPVAVPEASEAR